MLRRVKEEMNILHAIKSRMTDFIGHVLRRKCLPKSVIEEKTGGINVIRRRGMRGKQLLNDLKGRKIHRNLKEEAPDRAVWRTRFGKV
jgi:hypothetical protein